MEAPEKKRCNIELAAAIAKVIFTLNDIVQKLLHPRTLYTFMFFGVACYLTVKQLEVPQWLNNICISLLAFWFGEQCAKKQMEAIKNAEKTT